VARLGLEVADVFRRYGEAFCRHHGASLSTAQRRAMTAIELCRTAALGGHVEQCDNCEHQRISYNSCLMGKFRNGELGSRFGRSHASFRRFCSPLRLGPQQRNQLVGWSEGAFA
jgi:hypothetical protein